MKFFKENSYDIIKLYVTQVCIAIFSMMMYTAAGMINAESTVATGISVTISVFSTGFFYALLYSSAWEWGGKDRIRIDAGRMENKSTKALKMSLVGNIPNFILTVLGFVSFLFCLGGTMNVFDAIGSVCALAYRFTSAMYQGLVQAIFSGLKDGGLNLLFFTVESLAFLAFSLLSVLATHFGYVMGKSNKRIFGFIKSNKKYE